MRMMLVVALVACGGSDSDDVIVVHAPMAPEAVVASREGNAGPWQVLAATANRYELAVPADAYTVAVICAVPGQRRVVLYELRADEVGEIQHQYPCATSTATITGTLSGASSGARIYWGETGIGFPGSGAYGLDVTAATHDVVALRSDGAGIPGITRADRVVIKRGIAAGTSIDLDVSDAASVATRRLVVTGFTYNDRTVDLARSHLITSGGTRAAVGEGLLYDAQPLEIDTVPASALEPGELNLVTLQHVGLTSGNATPIQVEERAARDVSALAINFPPLGVTVPPQVGWDTVTPYALMHAVWKPAPAAAYRFVASASFGPEEIEWVISTSAAAMNAEGEIRWTFPDLSSVPGWSMELGFRTLASVGWTVSSRSGAALDQLIQRYPTVEATIVSRGDGGRVSITPR